jgi:ribosomal protein S18 acetylase RimI-like enzyme
MFPAVRIRRARCSDAAAIAGVHVEAWRNGYPGLVPNHVLTRLSVPGQAREWARELARLRAAESILVAELPGTGIVGFGSCGAARVGRLAHAAEIYTLYVAPEQQNQGIGRALLLRLFAALAGCGFDSAMVWVLAQNPSRFFYEAMGGRRIAAREEKIWNTTLPQAAYGWDDLDQLLRIGGGER